VGCCLCDRFVFVDDVLNECGLDVDDDECGLLCCVCRWRRREN